jgi:hypothetical protein
LGSGQRHISDRRFAANTTRVPVDLPLEAGVMTQVVRAYRDDLTRLDSELGQGHGFFWHLLLGVLHVEVVGIVRIA